MRPGVFVAGVTGSLSNSRGRLCHIASSKTHKRQFGAPECAKEAKKRVFELVLGFFRALSHAKHASKNAKIAGFWRSETPIRRFSAMRLSVVPAKIERLGDAFVAFWRESSVLSSREVLPRVQNIFEAAYRELRPRAPMPEIQVEFFPFSGINNTIRLREGRILVRVSDLLQGAPANVLHAIAHILIAKLYRKAIDAQYAARYRRYLGRRDMAGKAHVVRQARGRKVLLPARGRHYDLEEVFEDLNRRFFHGLLARPLMSWSRQSSRQSLGHYDPAHNTIVVSRIFDRAEVPRYAVEYLVYHEMLHLKHPVRLNGSRRCVHPPAFQAEEKLFPELEKAKALLKTL
jgi:hypothetical protein